MPELLLVLLEERLALVLIHFCLFILDIDDTLEENEDINKVLMT